ncbi:hypothetical protein ACFYPC_09535 [Streptomyces sp. NPDC005808]|uniref:hypothetical protein n=1 Tax=Streptomyces sp. NPDC005808 TaxID=3364734 RepID=UPI0036AEE7F9
MPRTSPNPDTYVLTTWPDDPTHREVRALASHLAHRLPEPADHDSDQARELLAELRAALDRMTGTKTPAVSDAEAAATHLELLRSTQYAHPLGDRANALVRTARQAERGGCRHGGPDACDSPTLRLRVVVYDPWCDEHDPACPWHAAQDALRWDHGRTVEVVLVGPRAACEAAQGHLRGQLSPLPRWTATMPGADA